MKSYTNLEQSKKLAEILPLESADMVLLHEEPYETSDSKFDGLHQTLCVPFSKYDKSCRQKYKNISYFPCWSLAALLDVLPDELEDNHFLTLDKEGKEYCCCYEDGNGNSFKHKFADNPIDACVAIIEHLHELKML